MGCDVPGAPIQLVYAWDAISSTRVHPLIDFAVNEVAERHKPGRSRTAALGGGPTALAGNTLARINKGVPELDVNAFVAELQDQAHAASAGNLSRSEGMLIAHAHTLDALFHGLTSWALNNAKEGAMPRISRRVCGWR
jgi:hypothetical protein